MINEIIREHDGYSCTVHFPDYNEFECVGVYANLDRFIDNSFPKDHMKGLGGMPKGVRKLINLLEP